MKINIGTTTRDIVVSTNSMLLSLVKDDLIDIDDITYKVDRREYVMEEGKLISINIIVNG